MSEAEYLPPSPERLPDGRLSWLRTCTAEACELVSLRKQVGPLGFAVALDCMYGYAFRRTEGKLFLFPDDELSSSHRQVALHLLLEQPTPKTLLLPSDASVLAEWIRALEARGAANWYDVRRAWEEMSVAHHQALARLQGGLDVDSVLLAELVQVLRRDFSKVLDRAIDADGAIAHDSGVHKIASLFRRSRVGLAPVSGGCSDQGQRDATIDHYTNAILRETPPTYRRRRRILDDAHSLAELHLLNQPARSRRVILITENRRILRASRHNRQTDEGHCYSLQAYLLHALTPASGNWLDQLHDDLSFLAPRPSVGRELLQHAEAIINHRLV